MSISTREIQLAARPHGEPKTTDFRLVSRELPDPKPGEVLVRNLVMSVDPYMRGRMNDVPSYAPPWKLDEPARGGAVGVVIDSASDELPVGSLVSTDAGWREHVVLPARHVKQLSPAIGFSTSRYLGVLGMTGLTAYAGLFRVAKFTAGDTVFVSGAAGAVGSLVGQFARLRGAARVIGSAGSPAKVKHLIDDLGFDAAFDYHDGPVLEQLRQAAPDGIDLYFDNVGAEHLEAAIGSAKLHARMALCGAISSYNATSRPRGPANMSLLVGKRLTLQGFLVSDHFDLQAEQQTEVGRWLANGELEARETVVEGLDHAVQAFIGMLRGENTGKMIVRLAPDPV